MSAPDAAAPAARAPQQPRSSLTCVLLALVLAGWGCAGGSSSTTAGTGSSQAGTPAAAGIGHNAAGVGATAGTFNNATPGAGAAAAGTLSEMPRECNELTVEFEPLVPTVVLLVDRSSSMFERGYWEPLKNGVLEAVQMLDQDIRFGLATYTGDSAGSCPDLTLPDTLQKGNYAMIEGAYNALGAPAFKGETPTAAALDAVTSLLAADQDPGAKFILLVTDGEPDFCDDPNPVCGRDSVVASVQRAHAQGIGTFIFSIGGMVAPQHLADVAAAGVGLPVADHMMAVQYQCAATMGTYGTATGSAPFFEPDINDRQALVDQLSSVGASVRSCLFDLQGAIKIDLDQAETGRVEVQGQLIPYGEPDGYRLNSATQLELLGAACERLRTPEATEVYIAFPCEALIVD